MILSQSIFIMTEETAHFLGTMETLSILQEDESASLSDLQSFDGSETSSRVDSDEPDERKEMQQLVHKENADVDMWREIVTGMLVITAALVTVTAYIYLSREEVDDFKTGVRPWLLDSYRNGIIVRKA